VTYEPAWRAYARAALDEDDALHDVTTQLLGEAGDTIVDGRFVAEARFVVAGLPLVEAVFREMDQSSAVVRDVGEGSWAVPDAVVARVRAPARALLAGERVALNYLQRLCGVATVTRRAVEAVAGTGAVITDTRKTTPGLRDLEKYAVVVGGGVNHRRSLSSAVLWKDNHWALMQAGGGKLADVIAKAPPGLAVQVEVESEDQLEMALEVGATLLLADNRTPDTIAAWVQRAGVNVVIEASGGITPETAGDFARAGAGRISIGALTHSPDPVSLRLDVVLPGAQ
jgi:nicotinate-nucleotide pyrophosphorylase (carboxylating)